MEAVRIPWTGLGAVAAEYCQRHDPMHCVPEFPLLFPRKALTTQLIVIVKCTRDISSFVVVVIMGLGEVSFLLLLFYPFNPLNSHIAIPIFTNKNKTKQKTCPLFTR